MNQETRSKHSNLKKRANFAIRKSDEFKTLDSNKKGVYGKIVKSQSRKVKVDDNASNVEDGYYKKRNDSVKLKSERIEGSKSNYRGRKEGEFHRNESNGFVRKEDRRVNANDVGSKGYNKRESRDAGGDRRKKSENGENRLGFLRKYGDAKRDDSKQLRSSAEEHKFGMKKVKSRKDVSDDSVTTFDRPRRKRRLIRVEYPHDTANKRFDDSLPTIDNTTEQNKDPEDTEENAEMSKNAQFRAIQPSPSIISFVNENLLGRRREIEFKKAGYNIELPSPLDNIPFSTNSERERIEESVFRNKLTFFAAAKVSSFPSHDLPEIAFAGRSNVGKSSLLNSLTRQWGVVRTSDKPGLTQTINFFNLGPKLCLVDLPGYGFAYAKEEVKESWEELVKEYVSTREELKRVCLLIDTKWGMKPRDHELVDLMERSKTKYQIVLTKTDLSFPVDVARRAMQIEESLKTKKSAIQPLMMVSSKTGAGIRSLRTVLSNVSRFARL
ncbi:putative small GTP-binding protein [Helianthus annuus]|nr:putative small GTP-binding protein [Helianthus annuus]